MRETLGLVVTIISMIFGIITLADGCCGPDENALINSRGKMDLYGFQGAYVFKKETKVCNSAAKDIETITIVWDDYRDRLQYTYGKIEANCETTEKRKSMPTTYASCYIKEQDIRKYTQYTLSELANLKTNTAPYLKKPKYSLSVKVRGQHYVGLETSRKWEHFDYLRSRILKACKGKSPNSYQGLDSIMKRLVKDSRRK
ncbi:MAG: hypothetical protein ACPG19_03680 [Saprospiraceae bacterium]